MRRVVGVILVVLAVAGLLSFLSFSVVTQMTGTQTEQRRTSWLWFGLPWRWYDSRTVTVTVGDKTEVEETGGLILLSPAWLILVGSIGLFFAAYRIDKSIRRERDRMANARRKLAFTDLNEVVKDTEHLLAVGYDKAGNWELAQVCRHLADWMRFPIEGFPRPPLSIRLILWGVRNTLGKSLFRKYVDGNAMPAGKPTMPQTVALPGGDPIAAVADLGAAVERFRAYTGEIHDSPLFGAMTKDDATRLQLIHCAHHLSFLVPKG